MHHAESQEFLHLGPLLSQWCLRESLTYILCRRSHGLVWTLLLFTAATSSSSCESSGSKACFVTACWWCGASASKPTRTCWRPSASISGECLTLCRPCLENLAGKYCGHILFFSRIFLPFSLEFKQNESLWVFLFL